MTSLNRCGVRPLARALALALAMPLTMASMAVHAQENRDEEQTQDEEEEDVRSLDRVSVTGSRIRRVEVEGPAPVRIITSRQIEREGFTTVFEALNSLTQTTGATQNELTQNGFTPNAQVLNLRGLGPGRALVLINGRRASDYPLPYNGQSNFVNLASIPAAAVDRIEYLSGGASAIYGSDAVAGVVNIIMKRDFEGDWVSLRAGYPTEGGDPTYRAQWIGGKMSDRWSVTYTLEYYNQGAIFASERDFMDSYRDDPTVLPHEATAVSGLFLRDRLTNPNTYLWPADGGLDEVCGRFGDFETAPGTGGGRCAYFGYPATQSIRNDNESLSGYLYATLDFDNDMQAFVQVNAWTSDDKFTSATQFWQSGLFYDPRFETILDTQRIFMPSEAGGFDGQTTESKESAIDATVGLNGLFFDSRFEWEFALSRSQYDVEVDRPRFLADPINEFFLGEQMGLDPIFGAYPVYEINLDRYLRPMTPEEFRAVSTIVKTDADSSNTTAQFVLTGDLLDMPAGPLGFAGVVEWGTQEYELIADPRILPGQQEIYNLTGTGGGGERDRYAVGLEFAIPLLDSVTATVAGRYDKYDDITDVDDAFTYNLGLEWRPVDSLLVRGMYATSFRAPDLHYVFADESGFFSTVFDEYNCRNDGFEVIDCGSTTENGDQYNYTAFGVRSGNPGLEEEEGESITFGVVWDVFDNFSVSVDYFEIELEGIVGDLSSAYILQNEADCRLGQDRQGNPVDGSSAFCQFIIGSVDRVQQGPDEGEITEVRRGPINRSYQSVEGIDASLEYVLETEREGTFRFDLEWSHVLDQKFAEFADEPRESYRDDPTNFDFRSRMRGSIQWEYGDFTTTLFATRWGSLPNWEETGRIGPYFIYNFTERYQATENLAFSLIIDNVFNKFHPDDDTFFTYPFFWRAYSPIGREVFVQVDYRF